MLRITSLSSTTGGSVPVSERTEILAPVSAACRDWGFFQVVNHGVSPELMNRAREVWREFFHLPMEIKQAHAYSPRTYEGYGSRLGVEKGAILDWSDYYFLHYLPPLLKDYKKWPSLPISSREVNDEYGKQVVAHAGLIVKILSTNLGLKEEFLQDAFGGDNIGACLRVNFYPMCPEPDLVAFRPGTDDPATPRQQCPWSSCTGDVLSYECV